MERMSSKSVRGALFQGKDFPGGLIFRGGEMSWTLFGVHVQIPMQDYKFLRLAVVIRATPHIIDSQTYTDIHKHADSY